MEGTVWDSDRASLSSYHAELRRELALARHDLSRTVDGLLCAGTPIGDRHAFFAERVRALAPQLDRLRALEFELELALLAHPEADLALGVTPREQLRALEELW